MKKLIFILLIVLISCNSNKKSTEAKVVSGPTVIEMDEYSHDFGIVHSGEKVVFTFSFKNTGNNDLIIKSAESDCGCVTINLPENNIKPGNQGKIEVLFDSSGLFGKELKTIELDWNCKEPKQLIIFATVENDDIEIIY